MGTDAARRLAEPIIIKSGDESPLNRLVIGTPTLGTIRMEWHQARISQIIPVNWAQVQIVESMGGYMPQGFMVADAQNLIVKHAIEGGNYEWLLLWEDDVLPPMDAFLKINWHMMERTAPVVSGLYYAKSRPPEPLIFRGRGNGVYTDFEQGDQVWADGVPTGFVLIHMELLRQMWPDCEEYVVKGHKVRRMFDFPRKLWKDPESGFYRTVQGTSDLDWCTRVMEGGYFEKAGWPEFADKEFPFLVDTGIGCYHINMNGETFP